MTDALSILAPHLSDLLGREPIGIQSPATPDQIRNSRVMITGAGGSIGSELGRWLLDCHPRALTLVENHENSLFQFKHSVAERVRQSAVRTEFLLADVRDLRKVRRMLFDFRPDIIFHLAAYKHVPLAEEFPEEFVLMNVVGTWNLSRAAREANVKKVVYPSTDKAVRSPSVYGATKRTVEVMLQALASEDKGTGFTVARLVDVLGAHGGVIETFVKQISNGEPITITHPEMTRYWITMSEALYLLVQAACRPETGEILLLDLGKPVKVAEVARKLWLLLRPGAGEMHPSYVGARPGERLSEELTHPTEVATGTGAPGVLTVKSLAGQAHTPAEIATHVGYLEELARAGARDELRRELFAFVR